LGARRLGEWKKWYSAEEACHSQRAALAADSSFERTMVLLSGTH
jgi:hypothetical protein